MASKGQGIEKHILSGNRKRNTYWIGKILLTTESGYVAHGFTLSSSNFFMIIYINDMYHI